MTAKADTNPLREAVATELIAHGEFSSSGNSYPNALLAADEVIKIVRAALASESVAGTVREAPLDLAWEAVNALGGSDVQNNSYDQGLVDGVAKALEAIEKLGGEDPLPKRNGPVVSPQAGATTASAPSDPIDKLSEMLLEDEVVTLSDNEEVCIDFGHISDFSMTLGDLRKAAWKTSPAPGAADRAEWQPIDTAPKDGTRILVLLKDPIPSEGRDDLDRWNGVPFVARHWGVITDSGFDIGWQFAAPVGQGGFPDKWIEGWMPIPTLSRADRGVGS